MTELLRQGRYWARAVAAGLYVLVIELIPLGHFPSSNEAWVPFLKGVGATLLAFGINARTRTPRA